MSKSAISYCGKFDLLYAVTVKAVGLEAEMEMRQKIGEVVDRLEPVINSVEKPGRVVVYVCTAHEAERTLKHTPFFKQSGAAVTHKTIIATVWTLPSKQEYDEFEAHCDLMDDMVVVWEHQVPVTLEIKFGNSMRSVTKDVFLKPFPTSRDAQALDAAVSKWFMDSLKVDPKIMMGGFPRFRNLGGVAPIHANQQPRSNLIGLTVLLHSSKEKERNMSKNSITQRELARLFGGRMRYDHVPLALESVNPSVLVQTYRCFPGEATQEMIFLLLSTLQGKFPHADFLNTTLNAYEKLLEQEAYPLFAKAFTAMTGMDPARENSKFIRFIGFLGNLRDPRTFLESTSESGAATNFAALASGRSNTHQLVNAVLRAELFDEKEDVIGFGFNPFQSDTKYFDVITPPKKEEVKVNVPEESSENLGRTHMEAPSRPTMTTFANLDHPGDLIAGEPGRTRLEVPTLEREKAYLDVVSDGANLFISGAAQDPETKVLISERFLWLERWYDFQNRCFDRSAAKNIDLKMASRASSELKRTIVIPVGHMSPYTMAPWLDL